MGWGYHAASECEDFNENSGSMDDNNGEKHFAHIKEPLLTAWPYNKQT